MTNILIIISRFLAIAEKGDRPAILIYDTMS